MNTKELLKNLKYVNDSNITSEEEVICEEKEWCEWEEKDGFEYGTHANGHEYLKIEKEDAKDFKTFKSLVYPDEVKTRYRMKKDGKWEVIYKQSELEKNALEFVGNLIGFSDTDDSGILYVDMENHEKYQELYWSIHDFIESGSGRDAFNIYYLFICRILGINKYKDVKNIIEMLSNYESNAANLVMSHRDHYVHSVYVFLIGLAIYNSNNDVKSSYKEYYMGYHKNEGEIYQIDLDEHFIRFWGITALFHDIGYIYEIPFEQIKSYGENIEGSNEKIFVAYKQVDFWNDIRNRSVKKSMELVEILSDLEGENEKYFLDKIFTYHIKRRLASNKDREVDWEHLTYVLNKKATDPEIACSTDGKAITDTSKIFMDHAYFSANIVFDILIKHISELRDPKMICDYMDAMTAILMHNKLFEKVIKNGKTLAFNEHPLAFLLMLCDELQIWNRTSFGVNSKGEMHAMGVDMSFTNRGVTCAYWYDKEFKEVKERKKSLSKMYPDKEKKFLKDIENIVQINNEKSEINVDLIVNEPEFYEFERYQNDGLSDGSLMVIYDLANELWKQIKRKEEFEELDIRVQNSYINRAKSLDRYLWERGYFYTDRKLGMHRLRREEFSDEDERSFKDEEMKRLKEELIRYGMLEEKDDMDMVKKYAIIPPIESAEEIWNAINAITGLNIYSFKSE